MVRRWRLTSRKQPIPLHFPPPLVIRHMLSRLVLDKCTSVCVTWRENVYSGRSTTRCAIIKAHCTRFYQVKHCLNGSIIIFYLFPNDLGVFETRLDAQGFEKGLHSALPEWLLSLLGCLLFHRGNLYEMVGDNHGIVLMGARFTKY